MSFWAHTFSHGSRRSPNFGFEGPDLDEKNCSGTALFVFRGVFGASVCTAPAGEATPTPYGVRIVPVPFSGSGGFLRRGEGEGERGGSWPPGGRS